MRQRGFGRIINISSVYGLFGGVNRVDHITTKTALIGFTRAVALETARENITCNAICPGSSPTPGDRAAAAGVHGAEGLPREQAVEKFMAARQPSGRFVGHGAAWPRWPSSCADPAPPTSPARPCRSTAAGARADRSSVLYQRVPGLVSCTTQAE